MRHTSISMAKDLFAQDKKGISFFLLIYLIRKNTTTLGSPPSKTPSFILHILPGISKDHCTDYSKYMLTSDARPYSQEKEKQPV